MRVSTAARVAMFKDSDGDSSGDGTDTLEKVLPKVDELVSRQHKEQSLGKLHRWEWRKQMLTLQMQRELVNTGWPKAGGG